MKTFIVATDFSPEAENALEYACAAANDLHARVILFNSYSFPIHAANARLPASSIKELEEHNKDLLKERAAKLSHKWGIEVDYEYGLMLEVSDELDNLVAKHQGDLVVMGMAPRSLAQELFGNTTTSVIMKQKYPVLAVPFGTAYEGINKILFACENKFEVPKKVLDKIREWASTLGAEVEIFHVETKPKSQQESVEQGTSSVIQEGLEGVNHYFKNVESTAVIREIENEVKFSQADLLIMMPKKYGFWDSLVHRSKTRIMASNNDVPLLSIP